MIYSWSKKKKHVLFIQLLVGPENYVNTKLSLTSPNLCLSWTSTPVQNSRSLFFLMDCFHACLISTALLKSLGRLASLAICGVGKCPKHLHVLTHHWTGHVHCTDWTAAQYDGCDDLDILAALNDCGVYDDHYICKICILPVKSVYCYLFHVQCLGAKRFQTIEFSAIRRDRWSPMSIETIQYCYERTVSNP